MMARLLTLLLERREYGKAEAELAKYQEKMPLSPELVRVKGEIAFGLGDRGAAREALKRAKATITLPSRDYRDYLWLARLSRTAGDNTEAEKFLRDGLTVGKHAPDMWLGLIDHLAQTHQRKAAEAELERLKKELPKDRQLFTIARCYEAMHLQTETTKAYQAALQERPNDCATLAFAADFYRRADQVDEAMRHYEHLLSDEVSAPAELAVPARRQYAVLIAQSQDASSRKRALALLDENAKTRGATVPDERVRLFIQGQSADAKERSAALNKFQHSLDRQIPTPEETLLLAQLLEATNNLGQARERIEALVDRQPQNPQYLVRLAQILVKDGSLDAAADRLKELRALEPDTLRVRAVQQALTAAQKKTAPAP
jgi:tetratricopeptide (TPR) repeat protein